MSIVSTAGNLLLPTVVSSTPMIGGVRVVILFAVVVPIIHMGTISFVVSQMAAVVSAIIVTAIVAVAVTSVAATVVIPTIINTVAVAMIGRRCWRCGRLNRRRWRDCRRRRYRWRCFRIRCRRCFR